MRKRTYLISIFFVWFLPVIILSFLPSAENIETLPASSIEPTVPVTISVLKDDRVEELDLDSYVASVLLAEMPASFEPEALKAQAVAIRTYTLRRIVTGAKHEAAEVCTDAGCCQAFAQLTTDEASEIMRNIVSQTKDVVLLYDGEFIDATYFSCSGGRTESALEVWGADVPYLQAQDSPGEEIASHYRDTYILTQAELMDKLDIDSEPRIEDISYTDGGGILSVTIGGKTFSGTDFRNRLSLKSTAATITPVETGFLITTQGFGHRVGMSQYGADAMALDGKNYQEILAYYYPGTSCQIIPQEELSRIFDKAGNL